MSRYNQLRRFIVGEMNRLRQMNKVPGVIKITHGDVKLFKEGCDLEGDSHDYVESQIDQGTLYVLGMRVILKDDGDPVVFVEGR